MILEHFSQQVSARPHNIAVSFSHHKLTYRELNERANYLAQQLLQLGVRHGDTVALLTERSVAMKVAILAILKCGAAYMPLERKNPPSHINYCFDVMKVKLVIADEAAEHEPVIGEQLQWLSTAQDELFSSKLEQDPDIELNGEDRAYVMFTSGSTGAPKAVEIPHRAVCRLVKDTNYISIKPTDCILQFAPLSFDASTFEVWGALLNGATLALYCGKGIDPNLLAKEIEQHNVSIMWLTAALFHMIANRYVDALKPLHTLLAGGDVLQPKMINKVLETFEHMTVINGYGPTENTTFTCCHRMTTDNPPQHNVPIGTAVSGTQVYILDEQLQPVAPTEEGELFIAGSGVALGYQGGSGQQNDSFFVNPQIADGLIYRSGDLVRLNDQQQIEFVGRKDNQIKVRGYRVSIEEIQNNLVKMPFVNDAVVMVKKFADGDQQLVAYLAVEPSCQYQVKEIKQALATELPEYMIPNRIILVDELKINKNGKIDRKLVLANK